MPDFDVIVVGAGHAGAEAAAAAARMGARVCLCTLSRDTVGHMPCNPAVGGTAKGHLVREIDALGGLMGRAIDATGIQFKLLNRSRGPAVWSPRAQADKPMYSQWVTRELESAPNIEWLFGRAGSLLRQAGAVSGLEFEDGRRCTAPAVVITTGTFLNGLVHIGPEQRPAGRAGEPPSVDLASSLRRLGFSWGRLKTGTPPRLSRRSIDFESAVGAAVFHVEHGDAQPIPFSFSTRTTLENRASCWLLHTTGRVHDLVRRNISQSPLFNGQIAGIGPRYCPSLEDKVMRFPDRERHQIFLEPEGLGSDEIYVNGFSMSLPVDVQEAAVRALPGLERAEIIRPGYAIEYDFIQPTELTLSLEARRLPGLFLAGQINGTSGYEEAAGQGIVAGINAAQKAKGQQPFVLRRNQAYIGIMIDDLVSKGCLEPYRMFTSRAEYRLLLRIDNADLRLTPLGRAVGSVGDEAWDAFTARRERYDEGVATLRRTRVKLPDGATVTADQALRRPDVTLEQLSDTGQVELAPELREGRLEHACLETTMKFEGYLRRQEEAVARARRMDDRLIPPSFCYKGVPGLSAELVQRFEQIRPATFGQALRIPGATPAAVAVVSAYVQRFLHEHA